MRPETTVPGFTAWASGLIRVSFLGDAAPDTVRVELYATGVNGGEATRQEMTRVRTQEIDRGCHVYCATVPASRPARLTRRGSSRIEPGSACRGTPAGFSGGNERMGA